MSAMAVHYSSQKMDWETPPAFFAELDAEFGFTLDVCALPHNTKCARFFSPADDGLTQSWGDEVCWMNPPYGTAIGKWMHRAYTASRDGATVVCLVPARTDTRWWHDFAMRGEIRFIKGRITFVGAKSGAPVVVFRPKTAERAA